MSGFWKSYPALSVTVVGGGRAGAAAARLLRRLGARVFITDAAALSGSLKQEFEHEEQGHTLRALACQLMVFSPGIRPSNWLARKAAWIRVPTTGELELAWRHLGGKSVAITGTNGKSTTTKLVSLMLGWPSAGNIGFPLASLVPSDLNVVLECSSFQLHRTDAFRPDVAVLLNMDQDHADWHGSVEAYHRAKARVFANQRPGDVLVANQDDPAVVKAVSAAASRVLWFSIQREAHAFLQGDKLMFHGKPLLSRHDMKIVGLHNAANALAAGLAAMSAGAEPDRVAQVLSEFPGLDHRVQLIRELNGTRFYDDSKATNPHAVLAALRGFDQKVVLIMGGLDKGVDFKPMREAIRSKVKAIVALGKAGPKIVESFKDITKTVLVKDMKQAVEEAAGLAGPGGVVLLSPACASFDMYQNYKQRGEDFANAVRGL